MCACVRACVREREREREREGHLPRAKATRFGSVSAPLMNVRRPIIPNWSCTMRGGMETVAMATENINKRPARVAQDLTGLIALFGDRLHRWTYWCRGRWPLPIDHYIIMMS